MIQFHAPEIESTLTLPETESVHAVRVLRKKPGDIITVVDGKGHRHTCRLTDCHPKGASVEILSTETLPPHWGVRITLAVAPTKNIDRIEWLLEKAVETGVDEVVMLKCDHSERKAFKPERLERVMVSAMKQSLKATLPHLWPEMVTVKEFINSGLRGELFMGYCDSNTERRNLVKTYTPGQDVVLLIGPEGDFSPEEVETARKAGFIPVTFGESRFRTESAALFALSAIHTLNQLNS